MRNVGGVFLVVDSQALVQMDLSQAIRSVAPAAEVHGATSLDQARALIEPLPRLTGAIFGLPVAELRTSGVAREAEARGAWIVCLNGRHTDDICSQGWHPLARPFAADDAQSLLRNLLDGGSRRSAR